MKQENERLYKNLVTILKMFKNRPYHLAKYLIENKALDEEFLKKILENDKLSELGDDESKSIVKAIYFVDISHMKDFFNAFSSDIVFREKTDTDIVKDLNQRLDECLKEERYEDAIRIRDYMSKNGIERFNNNS